jgi:hypothetical protein
VRPDLGFFESLGPRPQGGGGDDGRRKWAGRGGIMMENLGEEAVWWVCDG